MITVGTGVGGGIVIDGRAYRGATGAAGEIGHTLVAIDERDPGRDRASRSPGSLESLAAGHVLDRLAREAAAAHPGLGARPRCSPQRGAVAGPDAVAAARGRRRGRDRMRRDARPPRRHRRRQPDQHLRPEVVAIGGGVSSAGDLLLAPARAAALEYVLPGVGTATEIRIARSGPQAGVRGAALLARSELNRHHGEAR